MQQIADWLKKLGMSEYTKRFIENRVDLSVLPDLTDQDLEKLGVLLGDRRKMLRAIRDLGGASVPVTSSSAPVDTEPTRRDDAERRQLTVMFTDLVGSTALSSKLDPEDLRSVIGTYHKCVAETVARFDGFVAKYMGDGVLIYFGYPQAHEHDAERAVQAGLALVEAVPKLKTAAAVPLQVRVGIATGLVVVGDLIGAGAAQEQAVVGDTPNLAARLQTLAEPGTVVIAAGTRRLTSGLFEYRDLGTASVKGFGDPVQVWQVTGASAVESRFEALRTATTPLVGREEEIELLLRRWGQAKAGDGQVVLISGEPGIGKSRIAQRMVERLSGDPHTRMRYFCSPHHQDSALHPSIAQLERAASFRREDTEGQRLAKLEAVLSQGASDLSEAVPLLADLLSIPTGDRYPPLNLTPQKRKEKTLDAQVAQVEGLAARQPVLMVWEDVHWSDPTTRESLDLLIDRVPTLRVLVILTFRPEFTPPWIGRPHVTMLTLNRLLRRQRAEMITHVTGGKAQDAAYSTLLRSRRQQLHARIAAVLEERFPNIVSAQPALLAQHCAEAGLVERAIIYWLKAGRQAMTRSAMVEAIAQLTKGLELVSRLPVTRQTQQCELDLRMTLGTAFTAAKGYAASETGEAYARARHLCEELGDTPAFARVGYGEYLFHLVRAEVQRSHEVALEILSFAEKTGSEEALILGNRVLGVTLYERGEYLAAREHLKIARNLLERHQGQSGYATRGRDARIMIPTCEMYIASRQGFLDQALEARERALAEAEGSSLNSRLFALSFSAACLIIRGEYERAIHETDAICGIASDVGFPMFVACGLMLKGRAASGLGQEDGVSFLEKGLQLYRSTGAKWALPQWLGWFASAHGQQVDVARATLGEALAFVHETGERFNEAELYHLRGELSLSVSAADECASEANFLLAKRIAAHQGAKLLELRAAASLARLWRDQGKRTEALDLLAPVYSWFTEGFDTLDLKEAKALLEQLKA